MSVFLLDKTRKINKLLAIKHLEKDDVYVDMCEILSDVLGACVVLIKNDGVVLGHAKPIIDTYRYNLITQMTGGSIMPLLAERLLAITSTNENIAMDTLGFYDVSEFRTMVVPAVAAGERLATFFVYRITKRFDIEDIILMENAASGVGLSLMNSYSRGIEGMEQRKKMASLAVTSLSRQELKAAYVTLNELESEEGLVITKNIAQEKELTRSVIVNALKKLESSGVIECRSQGKKGTYIKIVNEFIIDSIDRIFVE